MRDDPGQKGPVRGEPVREVMLRRPKTLPADASVADVRAALDDAHVHLVLLVRDGVLRGTVSRDDLRDGPAAGVPAAGVPALAVGRLVGRTVDADVDIDVARARLVATGQRRLAVVGPGPVLLGLLCLKRDGSGFCSDAGVAARGRAAACGGRPMTPGLGVGPTAAEVTAARPGDDLVPDADVVMDRAFDLPAPPDAVWPWFVQLGKNRAGWYLPRWAEKAVPRRRRGLRRIDPAWQGLGVGDVIPDWGGSSASFEVAAIAAPRALVHRSARGHVRLSWAILLDPAGDGTRVHLGLRLGGVRRRRPAEVGGGLVDLITVAGLAAGLRERVRDREDGRRPG